MDNKSLPIILGVVILVGVGAFLLLGNQNSESPSEELPPNSEEEPVDNDEFELFTDDEPETPPPTEDETEALPETNEISFDIDMSSFQFDPNIISASPGDTVTVNVTSVNGTHDFVIDELNVATEIVSTGDSSTVTFTIPENTAVGTSYEFYCSVGNHRAQGMVGTLVVE